MAKKNYKTILAYIFLGFFSFLINFYYGSRGLFPIDSLGHFDTGYRILLGEFPFKDYWVVSGPTIDYIQALFFYLLGVSWSSYLAHTSLLNALLTLITYYFFLELKIKNFYSFFYAFFFSILAYTSSGTPFVDHHATFFSLIAIYMTILNLKNYNKFFCIAIPILFFLAFFSKQVPSAYLIIISLSVILAHLWLEKKTNFFKYYIFGVLISLLIFFIIGYLSNINFNDFLIQYIYYPPSIVTNRIDGLAFTFKNLFLDFKLIHLFLIPLVFLFFLNHSNKSSHNGDPYIICLFFFTVLSLIFHQLITQNQVFIFFLIPILGALLHAEIEKSKSKKKIYFLIIFIFTSYAVCKYHLRFNDSRKFHELVNVDFSKSIDAEIIDEKLKHLKWITPFEKNPQKELKEVIKSKNYIKQSKNNLMVITNYSFFSAILDKKIHSPIRWYISNGNSHPSLENKYYLSYKNLLMKKIISNNINEIVTIDIYKDDYIDDLLSSNCSIKKIKVNKMLISHLITNCKDKD